MRIAIFTESYAPVINGVSVAVNWLATQLGGEHAVTVFAPRYAGYEDPPGPYAVVRMPSYRPPGKPDYPLAWPLAPRAFADFARGRFDVVHTHSPFTLGHFGRRWARRLGIPLVTTYHTLYVEYAHYGGWVPQRPLRAALRLLSRAYCNSADQVAVPTEPIARVLREYGVRRPVSIIPTGLPRWEEVPHDPHYPREALGIPEDARLVLYAGRLAREKNLELLVEAFRRVAARSPQAHLLLAGSGPSEEDARRQVAAAGLQDRVTFAGFIDSARLRRCYADAAVMAFTSLTDTQGLVITEAKAAGLPVVSVDAYGPSAVVREGQDGYLVLNDPDPFAAALLRVLEDPAERARLSAGALADADRFRIETTAARYLELYRRARPGDPATLEQPERAGDR